MDYLECIMVAEQIEHLFSSKGYYKISSNLPEYSFYYHKENQGVTVLFVVDYRQGIYISGDQCTGVKRKFIELMNGKGEQDVHILTLILGSDIEKARKLCVSDSFCWIIDTDRNRLMIYEDQAPDFYGWKTLLEDFLACPPEYAYMEAGASSAGEEPQQALLKERLDRERIAKLPWVNICLAAVNLIVFLICTFTGELLYNKGAVGVMAIMEDRSFYRILTAMFLHSDVHHLFSNMIVLCYIGEIVEKKLGHIPYMALYFVSGIAGNIFSMGYELLTGEYYSSVGASGAVFGVEGALFLLLIMHRGEMEHLTVGRVAFSIGFSLYCGFTAAGVNNAAHIGGVLTGFAAAAVITMLRPRVGAGKDRGNNEG